LPIRAQRDCAATGSISFATCLIDRFQFHSNSAQRFNIRTGKPAIIQSHSIPMRFQRSFRVELYAVFIRPIYDLTPKITNGGNHG
jgi:hypothetical protein